MSTVAAALVAVLTTSVAVASPPRSATVLVAGEDSKYPKPRVSPGDISGDGPRPEDRTLENVALKMEPTEVDSLSLTAALAGKRVSVAMLGDERPDADRRVIGRSRARGKVVTTADDVSGWCTLQMTRLLKNEGVQVVSSGADLTVSGNVRRFFVDEGDRYNATVVLQLEVAGPGGAVLWKGEARGTASQWGRTYKLENYLQSLSNALVRAVDAWVTDPGFTAALGS